MPSPCLNGEVEGNSRILVCYMITHKRATVAGINSKGEVVSKPLSDSLLPPVNQSKVAQAVLFWCRGVTYLSQDCGVVKGSPYFLSIAIGIAWTFLPFFVCSFGALSVFFSVLVRQITNVEKIVTVLKVSTYLTLCSGRTKTWEERQFNIE